MKSFRVTLLLLIAFLTLPLLAGCSVQYVAMRLHDVPDSLYGPMAEVYAEEGGYLFAASDYGVDGDYLLVSLGQEKTLTRSVKLQKYSYDRNTKIATVTVDIFTPRVGAPQTQVNSNDWHLILRFKGPMENYRVVTTEGLAITLVKQGP